MPSGAAEKLAMEAVNCAIGMIAQLMNWCNEANNEGGEEGCCHTGGWEDREDSHCNQFIGKVPSQPAITPATTYFLLKILEDSDQL